MNCNECLPIIEEYVEDGLDSQTADQAAAHIAACESCRTIFDELQNEREIYSRYLLKIKERPQSWNAVRAEIRKESNVEVAAAANGGTFGALVYEKLSAIFYRQPLFGATAAVLILIIGFGLVYRSAVRKNESLRDLAASVVTENESQVSEMKNADPFSNDSPSVNSRSTKTTDEGVKDPASAKDEARILKTDKERIGTNKSISYPPPAIRTGSQRVRPKSLPTTAVAQQTKKISPSFDSSAAAFNNHLEKCEMVLRSFRNAVLEKDESGFDVSYERRLAKELLSKSIRFRREAQSQGNLPIQQLLVGLETVLGDIAGLPEKATFSEANSIKGRIRESGIVARLQIRSSLALASD